MNSLQRLAGTVTLLGAALAVGGCSTPPKKKQLSLQEMITADPLPLAKGSKWTYAVVVHRFDPEAEKVLTKQMSWTTEVVDAKEGNGVTAYRVKGWPTDLAEFDSGSAPGSVTTPAATERTILRSGNNFLFAAPSNTGEPSLDGAEGWFSWPVIDGQKICPSAGMVYCWQVTAVETGYKLSFYTGPDEQSFELEPGTGVAKFQYKHHGTTNDVEANLVSYEKAGGK
jgi:hypothetical protein